MSRIGKQPIAIPSGVKVGVSGQQISIEGPRGKLGFALPIGLKAAVADGKFALSPEAPLESIKAAYGSSRAHINNMIIGVSTGWKKSLELVGVGFAAKIQGTTLVLSCGYSHDVEMTIPQGVKCAVTKNTVDVESIDKRLVGEFAANVRKVQPPEPYLGKGIKYAGEVVRRKAGKTGKK